MKRIVTLLTVSLLNLKMKNFFLDIVDFQLIKFNSNKLFQILISYKLIWLYFNQNLQNLIDGIINNKKKTET